MKSTTQVLAGVMVLLALTSRVEAQQNPAVPAKEPPKAPPLDNAAQLKQWIRQLNDRDYRKRDAAVQALADQPAAALPWLEQTLKSETDAGRRWWLEAAIRLGTRDPGPWTLSSGQTAPAISQPAP